MRILTGLTMAAIVSLIAGCGGGSSSSTAGAPAGPTASTAVQINLGDAPSDRLLAANMHIQSLSFTDVRGDSVPVLAASTDMELMQSMGTVRPLVLASMPQGAYAGATMTFAGATVTYNDPSSGQVMQRTLNGPLTATVSFDPAFAVGSTPMVVNLDIDMARSLAIDGNGNVSLMPAMAASWRAAVPGSGVPEDGAIVDMTGVVRSVSGNALHLAMLQGDSEMPLMTDAATEYVGIGGMGGMNAGMLVAVDGTLQPDGTWRASRVRAVMPAAGVMAMGVVTEITGSPPAQLVLAMQDGAGPGMMRSNLAGTATVTLTDSPTFGFDAHDVDLSALPFTPRFDATTMSTGQRVATYGSGAMMQGGGMGGMAGGSTLTASNVQLVPQGLRGTVSGYAASGTHATFTLTVAADAALATLSGKRSVTVYQQPGTRIGPQSIADGASVIVRGLLFVDNSAFRFVATHIVGA